ncbi:MAG: AAA family ATPase [Anaerolineales bacterium]|nr:AAA family ATPase [Anaerolineales bacterium]
MDLMNPFVYGRALYPAEFIGRKQALRHLFSRLATGQSTALIGQPHLGKTSLLNLLANAEVRQQHVGSHFAQHIFSFVDAHPLRSIDTQAAFWDRALRAPEDAIAAGRLPQMAGLYEVARANNFGTFVLEQLFRGLAESGAQLVLLLDEFDDFLTNEVLHKAEFYGSLRSLASRSPGLMLVIACRRNLEELNQLTQTINPHGSPYFNVFTELELGPLSHKTTADLLDRAQNHFNRTDRQFVFDLSGRHPYLVQAAAAALWDAHSAGLTGDKRYHIAAETLYRWTQAHFADTWRVWSNVKRKAVTAVALQQFPYLLPGRFFQVDKLAANLDDYSPELDRLAVSGMVARDEQGTWRVTQQAFLWWLADELYRNVREESDFTSWLQQQSMDGIFTRQERERMGKAVKQVTSILGKGATAFIEAYAKGLAAKNK